MGLQEDMDKPLNTKQQQVTRKREPIIQHNQYRGCWWPGNRKNNYCINLVLPA